MSNKINKASMILTTVLCFLITQTGYTQQNYFSEDFILAVDSEVQSNGSWTKDVSNRLSYPEHLYTDNNGASLEVQFQGTGIVFVLEAHNNSSYSWGEQGAGSGTVEGFVDGNKQIDVQINNSAREITMARNLSNGSHTARIVFNGSGRCRVLGFRVLQGPTGDIEMTLPDVTSDNMIDVRAIVYKEGEEIRNTLNRNWISGATALGGLPVGEHDLEIRAFGWVTHRQKINIEDGVKTNLGAIELKRDPATVRNGFEFPVIGNQAIIKMGESFTVDGPTSGVTTAKLRGRHGPAVFSQDAAFSGSTVTVSGITPPGLYDLILTTSTGEERIAPSSVYVVKDYPTDPSFMGWGHLNVWGQFRTEFLHRVVEMVNLVGPDMVLISNAVNGTYISGAMSDVFCPYIINFGNHQFDGHEKIFGPDVEFLTYGPDIQILNLNGEWSGSLTSQAESIFEAQPPAPIRIINSFEGNAPCGLLDGYNINFLHFAHGSASKDGTRCNSTYTSGKFFRYVVFNNNQADMVPGSHINTDGLREPEIPLNAVYAPANDGTNSNVTAEVTNDYVPVPNGRLVFLMPAGSYSTDEGTIESEVTSDDRKYTVVTVRTPFPLNQKTTVVVTQESAL